jgi:DNA-binding MarR family transcriptional regulator
MKPSKPQLSIIERKVLGALAEANWPLPLETIASATGTSIAIASAALHALIGKGFVETIHAEIAD